MGRVNRVKRLTAEDVDIAFGFLNNADIILEDSDSYYKEACDYAEINEEQLETFPLEGADIFGLDSHREELFGGVIIDDASSSDMEDEIYVDEDSDSLELDTVGLDEYQNDEETTDIDDIDDILDEDDVLDEESYNFGEQTDTYSSLKEEQENYKDTFNNSGDIEEIGEDIFDSEEYLYDEDDTQDIADDSEEFSGNITSVGSVNEAKADEADELDEEYFNEDEEFEDIEQPSFETLADMGMFDSVPQPIMTDDNMDSSLDDEDDFGIIVNDEADALLDVMSDTEVQEEDSSFSKVMHVEKVDTRPQIIDVNKEKELALREREMDLRERELKLREQEIELERQRLRQAELEVKQPKQKPVTIVNNIPAPKTTFQKNTEQQKQIVVVKEEKAKQSVKPDYDHMTDDKLWKYMAYYMDVCKVRQKPVAKSKLIAEFGANNVKRMAVRGYIIAVGDGFTYG